MTLTSKRNILMFLLMIQVAFLSSQNVARIDSILSHAAIEKSLKTKAYLYSMVAEEYYFNVPDSAIKYCFIGMRCSQKLNDYPDLSYFNNFLGVLYKNIGKYDTAMLFFEKSIEYYRKYNFDRGVASSKNNIGKLYLLKGEYDQSLHYFNQSLEVFEHYKDTLNIGELHSSIGGLFLEIEEYEAAEEHFNLSRQYYQLAKAELQEGWILYDLGNLKFKTGEFAEAIQLFEQSSKVWKKFNRKKDYYTCAMRIGEIKMEAGKYKEAEILFQKAKSNFEIIKNNQGVSESLMMLGRVNFKMKNYNKAIMNLQGSLQITGFIKSMQLQIGIYYELYQCYKAIGNTKLALLCLEEYNKLNDSTLSFSKKKTLAEFQIKMGLRNKELTIKALEDSTQKQALITQNIELQNRQKQNGINVLVIGIIIIAIFLFLLFFRFRKNITLNKALNKSLKEREVLIREVHHRVKNNLQIISSLLNLQSEKSETGMAKELLQMSQSRIEAMSMIHENLYQSKNLSDIELKTYVVNLCQYIEHSYSLQEKKITFEIEIEPISLVIDQLVPCGLIITEIVTNSIKHAFDESQGKKTISITARKLSDNKLEIVIKDNGKGMAEGFDISTNKTLGMRLTMGLARQLKGDLKYYNDHGFVVQLSFNFEMKNIK